VIERINRLKQRTVDVKAGRAVIYAQFVPESPRRAFLRKVFQVRISPIWTTD
jgi:hypothetical protein